MVETGQLRAVADDGRGHARVDTGGNDFVGRTRLRPRPQDVIHLVSPHASAEHRREFVVGREIIATHHGAECKPLLRRHRRDADVAVVGGRFVTWDHDPPEGHRPAAGKAGHDRRHRHERQLHGLEHRHVDVLGDPSARRPPPRGRRAERREGAGDVLAQAATDGQRSAVGQSVARQTAAARLQHLLRKIETVVGTTVSHRRDRDGDRRGGPGDVTRLTDEHDLGVLDEGGRDRRYGAATCAGIRRGRRRRAR